MSGFTPTVKPPEVPPRETLLRNGIPPEVMQHFREEATVLRAQAFRRAWRRLWRASGPAIRRDIVPA